MFILDLQLKNTLQFKSKEYIKLLNQPFFIVFKNKFVQFV